jgi:glycerol uptake facilitator-like aquaporin
LTSSINGSRRQRPCQLLAGRRFAGYGDLSPVKYHVVACFIAEAVATFFFLFVILGSTHRQVPTGFAPIPRSGWR